MLARSEDRPDLTKTAREQGSFGEYVPRIAHQHQSPVSISLGSSLVEFLETIAANVADRSI